MDTTNTLTNLGQLSSLFLNLKSNPHLLHAPESYHQLFSTGWSVLGPEIFHSESGKCCSDFPMSCVRSTAIPCLTRHSIMYMVTSKYHHLISTPIASTLMHITMYIRSVTSTTTSSCDYFHHHNMYSSAHSQVQPPPPIPLAPATNINTHLHYSPVYFRTILFLPMTRPTPRIRLRLFL